MIKYVVKRMRQNVLVPALIFTLVSLYPGFSQDVPKPHAEHLATFGQVELDQSGGFAGQPRDLEINGALRDPSHVVFGYHPYWNGSGWQNYNYELLSHIAWFGLEMNNSGNITNDHAWPINGLVDLAHSHGVKVIVTVTNFDNDGIGTLLASAANRQNAINTLLAEVTAGNADGVNIDFEFVPSGARANFNTFIHDLTQAFHDQIPGSEVSIAMPSVDWWGSYDYNYLSDNCDGLMIMAYGYYWGGSANAGPISPLNSGFSSWYIRRTIEDYLTKTGDDPSQLILGLPWYGYNWPVVNGTMGAATTGTGSSIVYSTAEPSAQSYGKNYNANAPAAWYNYSSGGTRQVWYDDSLSLATKYNYIKDMDLKGLGIWALGYDGGRSEIWGGLSDAFGASAPPLAPAYFSVQAQGDGQIRVECAPTTYADTYQAHVSTDGVNFFLADSSAFPEFLLSGFPESQIVYVKVRCGNQFGVSNFSELLGVVPSSTDAPHVLIVQGFERTSGTVNNFDYIIEHGEAVLAAGRGFDSASNDAVENGQVNLDDYLIVDWISGEEATATVSFSPAEQDKIAAFLEQGGRILISGSEIGWDLEASGSTSDQAFYHNYFKADYISDDAQSYSTYGTNNGIFVGLSGIAFDNGNHGTYDVDYPDGIKPLNGSVSNLRYEGTDYDARGGAGIQYLGHFGSGSATGGIVYLAVGLETFYPGTVRASIMERVLTYLESQVAVDDEPLAPASFQIVQCYPNPFNSRITVKINMPQSGRLTYKLVDLKGRQLVSHTQALHQGLIDLQIDFSELDHMSSGLYLLQIDNGVQRLTQRLTYLK